MSLGLIVLKVINFLFLFVGTVIFNLPAGSFGEE